MLNSPPGTRSIEALTTPYGFGANVRVLGANTVRRKVTGMSAHGAIASSLSVPAEVRLPNSKPPLIRCGRTTLPAPKPTSVTTLTNGGVGVNGPSPACCPSHIAFIWPQDDFLSMRAAHLGEIMC
jgi:hypothetical protein